MAGQNQERSNFPTSPACGHWETLLVDAMDGLLQPEDEQVFSSHMSGCVACTEMFEQVRRGREWLELLAPEPEVPVYLLDRILGDTGHGKVDVAKFAPAQMAVAGGEGFGVLRMPPVWQQRGFSAKLRRFAEPRLLMTAAMAFFSIALTLSITGVRFSSVKMADLRPKAVRSAVEKRIMTASTPFVRYYDHLRFVYEVESTMREMKRNSESGADGQNQQKSQPDGGSGETHKKDGGSQASPTTSDPSRAPQQTVNPPISLRSGDVLEVRYDKPAAGTQGWNWTRLKIHRTKSLSILAEGSGRSWTALNHPRRLGTNALAMPERSTSCNA